MTRYQRTVWRYSLSPDMRSAMAGLTWTFDQVVCAHSELMDEYFGRFNTGDDVCKRCGQAMSTAMWKVFREARRAETVR